MNSWIKTDFHFGDPWTQLVLPLRSQLALELVRLCAAAGDDPVQIENVVTQFIEQHRPDLEGCTVITMAIGWPGGMTWRFTITHPSLPRRLPGEMSEQRLELCPICRKPLSLEKQWMGPFGAEVCSEECSKKVIP